MAKIPKGTGFCCFRDGTNSGAERSGAKQRTRREEKQPNERREEDDRGCTWAPTRPQRAGKKARRRGHGWLVAHNATASSTIRVATPIMAVAKGE